MTRGTATEALHSSDPLSSPSDAEALSRRIADLWRRALSPMLHGANCGCCAGSALVMTPAWLEEDVLTYLSGRIEPSRNPALSEALRMRLAAPHGGFLQWLASLETEGLLPAHADQLRLAVAETLAGLDTARPVR